jgi:hypothetical protein
MSSSDYSEVILEKSRKDSGLAGENFGKSAYDLFCVPLELYKVFKNRVLKLSLAYQKWEASPDGSVLLVAQDQLSDQEIAEKLGLTEDEVMRIRCMAEWDIPIEVWRNAAEFKRRSRLEKPLGSPRRTIRTEPG